MLIELKNYVTAVLEQFTNLKIQLTPLRRNPLKMSKF